VINSTGCTVLTCAAYDGRRWGIQRSLIYEKNKKGDFVPHINTDIKKLINLTNCKFDVIFTVHLR